MSSDNKTQNVVAIDPGGTSGFVWGFRDNWHFQIVGFAEVSFGLSLMFSEVERCLAWAEEVGGPCAWVLEDFVLYAATAQQLTGARPSTGLAPVYQLGVIETVLAYNGVPRDAVFHQMKAQANLITNERLKKLGLWIVGKQHARDAARHAELWCRTVREPIRGHDLPR